MSTENGADDQGQNIQRAISFLRSLRGVGPWTVCALDPERPGPPVTATFKGKAEIGQMRNWIAARYGKRNLHLIVNPTKRRINKKPLESDIAYFQFAHVDLDPLDGESPADAQKRHRAALADFKPLATMHWVTGNGVCALWRVEPFKLNSDADIQGCKAINVGIIRALGGKAKGADSCQSLDHLLRLPYTPNLPDARKRAKGRKREMAGDLKRNDRCYDLFDFPVDATAASIVPDVAIGDAVSFEVDALPATLQEAINKDIEKGKRNEHVFGVICNLIRKGISNEQILWILTNENYAISERILERGGTAAKFARDEITRAHKKMRAAADDFEGQVDPGYKSKPKKSNTGSLDIINAAMIQPRNIEFIWENRLALGTHTALAGIGGMAKSQIMYRIIATITTGGKWPDGGRARKGRCTILSAEEGREDMIVPRLLAAGADLSLVDIIKATREDDGTERKFNLQADLGKLKKYCKEKGDVLLVAFDPVSSYMGGDLDTHRNTAVRHVLDPITSTAEDIGCCVLSITHFNKGSSNKAIHHVMESAAFVNAPRASFGVFEDPEDSKANLFLVLKTNMKRPDGLRYTINDKNVGKDPNTGKPINAPFIEWDTTSPVTHTADDVVQAQTERKTPRLDQAVIFLEQALADGPTPVADIKARADAEGITYGTLRRAMDVLGIQTRAIKGTMPAKWKYVIPLDEFEDSSL